MSSFSTVPPVFLKSKAIPESVNNRPTVLEVCVAAERVAGQGSILGAQDIGGLWRIYPATRGARTDILVKGLSLRGTTLQVANTNPYILRDDTGEEKQTTKVWIDNVPISVADSEIEHSLVQLGCDLRSNIKMERARDSDGKLTRFLTGRRFLFISVPPKPLEKLMKVSIFTAKVYHKEQKSAQKSVTCSRCLQPNHHVSDCPNDIVCRVCKQSGHKCGDQSCQLADKHADRETSKEHAEGKRKAQTQSKQGLSKPVFKPPGEPVDRSRPPTRQPTLLSSLEQASRSRSNTPKRGRSRERHSPRERTGKLAKRDHSRSVSPEENGHSSQSVTADQWG